MPLTSENAITPPSKLIAMLVDQVSDPFFASLSRRIDRRARALGYKLVLGSTENDTGFMPELLSVFNNMKVAGYIIAPPAGAGAYLETLVRKGKPVVLLDRCAGVAGAYTVLADHFRGAYEAVGHLIEGGRRHIALVTVNGGGERMVWRRKGYEAAVGDHSVASCVVELPCGAGADEVREAMQGLLLENQDIDGLLFADAGLAFSGVGALRQLRVNIPGELALVGFDDNENFQYFAPALTAVVQPLDKMVDHMLQCIAGHVGGNGVERQLPPVVLPTRLVIRSSSLTTKAVAGPAIISKA